MAAELKVGIGAETTELKAGLKDAEAQIKKFLDNVVSIGKVGEKLQSIGTKLSVGVTAPIVALSTVALKAFSDLEGVRIAFNRLNDPTLLDNLRKATKGTTSDLELMQAAVKSEKFGLSTNALPTLLEYAGRVAKDTGQEVSYLVDSITTGIGRKSPLILDNLGISASQLKAELGGVSMEAASVATVTEAVGRIAARELAKMGKDTKTLSESWLQVKTAVNNSMGKIGEIISKNLDISGIIDKLTGYINSAVSAFENLSPTVQKSILVVTGLVAAAGPLLVVIGGLMQLLPTLTLAVGGLGVALAAIVSPIGLAVTLLASLAAGFLIFHDYSRTATQRNDQWKDSLANANAEASTQVAKLTELYKATQDTSKSIEERTNSVNQLQKTYPIEFGNINKQIILNGQAEGTYKTLANSIYDLARAKAAEVQIQKITQDSFNKEIELRKQFNKEVENFKNPKAFNYQTGTAGTGFQEATISAEEMQKRSASNILKYVRLIKENGKATEAELKIYADFVGKGFKEIANASANGANEVASVAATKITAAKAKVGLALLEFGEEFKQNTAGFMVGAIKFDDFVSMDTWFNDLTLKLNEAVPKVKGAVAEFSESIIPTFTQLNDELNSIIQDSIGPAIFNAFDAIGQAIGSGGDVISAIGNSLLSSLGGFLSEMGKKLIEYGTLAVVKGKLDLAIAAGGPIAIAAGIAAIAIGAALSIAGGAIGALAKKGSSGGSSGSISSGVGTGSQSYSSSYSSGGSGGSEFVFRISGNDLVTVTDRARDKNLRIGG